MLLWSLMCRRCIPSCTFMLARMGTVSLLLIFVTVDLVAAQLGFSSPCYLSPPYGGGKLIDLEIPENCTIGTVDWNYPVGTIKLRLTRTDGPYLLCLERNWATTLGGLKKVVNGVETEIPLPTQDLMACAEDFDGKTKLLISATSNLLYMTSFDYRVVMPAVS